jgi:hypothetical protein
MANTRFEPHFIQDSLYNTKYSNVCAQECEAFKLGFILLSSLFIYKFSSQFFKASQSSIRPLECSYKSLFNYSNNHDNNDEDDHDEDDDVISEEETTEVEENNQNNQEETTEVKENNEVNDNTIEDTIENTIEDDNDPYNYKDFFSDKEFKLVLFNYLKNKDSNENLKNLEDSNKYKEFIENLEKDTLGYVYI